MLTLYSKNTVTLGSPGIDDEYGSSVSMRGVVSSTSTNKLTILITGRSSYTRPLSSTCGAQAEHLLTSPNTYLMAA